MTIMKVDFSRPIVRLIYCWIGVLLMVSVISIIVQFLLVPSLMYLFQRIPISLPTTAMLSKTVGFIVYCSFTVGTIMWLSNEVKVRREKGQVPETTKNIK